MMKYSELSKNELDTLLHCLQDQYERLRSTNLNLDLTRGKPSAEQLDLANELDGILGGFYLLQDGTDVRNYGGLPGIPEARALGAGILALTSNEVLVGGNSSLTLMYQYVHFMTDRYWGRPGNDSEKIKFLCPVPGYDRHFTICEHFDIEMINVEMTAYGPDMDLVESMVKADLSIKGIWCVPKYSNPTGITFSDATVQRLSKLASIAGADFRIIWDNAYCVHHLSDQPDILLDIMEEARVNGTTSSIVMFASTSKITFAGAGISFIGMNETSLASFETFISASTIGADKVNQLRHVRFLSDNEGIALHMKKHRDILKPLFEETENILRKHLADKAIASWTRPNGGYFVSLDTMPGLAGKIVALAGEIGVKLTPAGATFPYGTDPEDKNIRIAPTYLPVASVREALDVLVVCLELASVQHLIESDDKY